jgi:hypothetical protein
LIRVGYEKAADKFTDKISALANRCILANQKYQKIMLALLPGP